MTGIEIIRAMEKILDVPLPRLEPGDIGKRKKYKKRDGQEFRFVSLRVLCG
jgi:hypothetical protein